MKLLHPDPILIFFSIYFYLHTLQHGKQLLYCHPPEFHHPWPRLKANILAINIIAPIMSKSDISSNSEADEGLPASAKPTLWSRFKAHLKRFWWAYSIAFCISVLVIILPMWALSWNIILLILTVPQLLCRDSQFREWLYQQVRVWHRWSRDYQPPTYCHSY